MSEFKDFREFFQRMGVPYNTGGFLNDLEFIAQRQKSGYPDEVRTSLHAGDGIFTFNEAGDFLGVVKDVTNLTHVFIDRLKPITK